MSPLYNIIQQNSNQIQEIINQILIPMENEGFQAYFVGGCVRDYFLSNSIHDYDIATSAKPSDIHRIFREDGPYPMHFIDISSEKYGIVAMNLHGIQVEISSFRIDTSCDGRHASVSMEGGMYSDSWRRDFTINALYMDKNGKIYDPTGKGINDLENKRIRFVGWMDERVYEDSLRVLRAMRFASCLNFSIVNKDELAMLCKNEKFRERFQKVSHERVGREMAKLICGGNAPMWIRFILEHLGGASPQILPHELIAMKGQSCPPKWHSSKDNLEHSLVVFEKMCSLTSRLDCRVAALFHDMGKLLCQDEQGRAMGHERESERITRKFLKEQWKFSNEMVKKICDIVGEHMTMHQMAERKIHKIYLYMHSHDFPALMMMLESDCVDNPFDDTDYVKLMQIKDSLEILQNFPLPPPEISGDDIISMGIMPCKEFKKALEIGYSLQLQMYVQRLLGKNPSQIFSKKSALKVIRQFFKEKKEGKISQGESSQKKGNS